MLGTTTRSLLAALVLTAGAALVSPWLTADAFAAPRSAPVAAGELAPDFALTDQNGDRHTLSAERGKRSVVLVFYRGHW